MKFNNQRSWKLKSKKKIKNGRNLYYERIEKQIQTLCTNYLTQMYDDYFKTLG